MSSSRRNVLRYATCIARSSMSPLPYGPHRSQIPSWPQATFAPAARSRLIGGTGKL